MKTIPVLIGSFLLLLQMNAPVAQAADAEAERKAERVVDAIERAHGKAAWEAREAVEVEARVDFHGGKLVLDGTMLFTPSLGKVRYTLDDGTTMIWNDGEVWLSPADAELKMARFHVMTWPYFVAVPFKLRDPGARLSHAGELPVTGPDDTAEAVKLTFTRGTGDASDDWYYLLPDERNRLAGLSYIVTYGPTSRDEAEEKPSIVLYDDFREVDGVTLPFAWRFHYWNKQQGATGEPKGTVEVRSVRFVTPEDGAFEKPADAKRIPPPGE